MSSNEKASLEKEKPANECDMALSSSVESSGRNSSKDVLEMNYDAKGSMTYFEGKTNRRHLWAQADLHLLRHPPYHQASHWRRK